MVFRQSVYSGELTDDENHDEFATDTANPPVQLRRKSRRPGLLKSDRLTFLDRPAQQVIQNCFARLSS